MRNYTYLIIYIIIFTWSTISNSTSISSEHEVTSRSKDILHFLENELIQTTSSQENLKSFLHKKFIPIGVQSKSLRKAVNQQKFDIKSRIIESKDNNFIECRIALGRAPIGSICVAPCGCTGSQKWIQFSELNRLRRNDPNQWHTCQTCRQKFEYDKFCIYGGVPANLIGLLFDHKNYLRIAVGFITMLTGYLIDIHQFLLRFFTSKLFWNLYPQWSHFTRLPAVLKFWGGKILLQYVLTQYIKLENLVLQSLASIETKLIEDNLPIERLVKEPEIVDNDTEEDSELIEN